MQSVWTSIWIRTRKWTRGPWATSLTWENSSNQLTHDYHNLNKRRKIKSIIYFMGIEWFFIWTNMNPLHPRMLYAKFGWNRPSGSGEEDFKIHQCIFTISKLFPLGKGGGGSSFQQTWITFTKGYFVPIFDWNWPSGSGMKIFIFRRYIFAFCAKFGWNWPSGSWEEDFYISSIHNYRLFEKEMVLHLNKLDSHSPKDALCLV